MKRINSAVSLLKSLGGLAERQALVVELGWEPDQKAPAVNNPAGSKLSRQIKRGNKGLTCRNGFAINKE